MIPFRTLYSVYTKGKKNTSLAASSNKEVRVYPALGLFTDESCFTSIPTDTCVLTLVASIKLISLDHLICLICSAEPFKHKRPTSNRSKKFIYNTQIANTITRVSYYWVWVPSKDDTKTSNIECIDWCCKHSRSLCINSRHLWWNVHAWGYHWLRVVRTARKMVVNDVMWNLSIKLSSLDKSYTNDHSTIS